MENKYELMLINKPNIGEKEEKKIFEKIDELLKGKGKIEKRENLGKRQLAYRIRKETEGNYWLFNLDVNPAEIAGLSSKFAMENDVLRFLILRKDLSKKKLKNKIPVKSRSVPSGKKSK